MATNIENIENDLYSWKQGLSPAFWAGFEQAVRGAGKMIRDAVLTEDAVHEKEGLANFVTNFDVAVQQYLMEKLKALLPDASFFGEEDTEGNDKETGRYREGYCFYIDPIDGTTNFIFGYQFSCVSVGLSYNGKMVAGMVYNPYVDGLYRAVRGEGAYLNDKQLHMKNTSIENGIVAFGCARYNEGDTDLLFASVKEIYLHSLSVRNGGSAALDLCRIAAGANVAYLEMKLQPYDYAAASVVIEEAGGQISRIEGGAINLDGPCSILAGSEKARAEIRAIVESRKI